MFYCVDLLRKNGKFSVIWLAATKENSLKKRDFLLVNLGRTCSDLKDYIVHERNRPRLSLYLSSQLLHGTIKVYSRQVRYLLGDTLELYAKIRNQSSLVVNVEDINWKKGRKRSSPFESPKYTIDLPMSDVLMGFNINSSLNLPSISELPSMDDLWFTTDGSILDPLANTVPKEEITMVDPPDMPQGQIQLYADEEMFKIDMVLDKELSTDYISNLEEPATVEKNQSEPEFVPLLNPKVVPKRSQVDKNEEVAKKVHELDICLAPLLGVYNIKKTRKRPRALLIDPVIQFSKDDIKRNLWDTSPTVRPFIVRTCKDFKSAELLMKEPMRTSMVEIPLKRMMRRNMAVHPRLVRDTSPEANDLNRGVQEPKKDPPVRRKLDLPKHMSTPLDKSAGNVSKAESALQLPRDASTSKDSIHFLSRSNISTIGSSSRIQEAVPPVPLEDSLRESFIVEQLMDSVQSTGAEVPDALSFEQVLIKLLAEHKHVGSRVTFKQVCPTSSSKKDAAKCFTKLLEGIRKKQWKCRQDHPMGEIEIYN